VRTPADLTDRIAGVFFASDGGLILSGAADGDLRARFAIDIGDGECPERDEVDTRDEFGGEGGKELPMPAEKVGEQAADAEVEDVVDGRLGALDDPGEDGNLEDVGDDGEDHGDAQTWTGGDFDGFAIEVSGRRHGVHN